MAKNDHPKLPQGGLMMYNTPAPSLQQGNLFFQIVFIDLERKGSKEKET